jgi:outer membrane protein assembly factor BamB
VFVLDANSGETLRSYTSYGPATTKPAYVDATGAVWFASNETVYGIPIDGASCTYDVKDRVTTSLEVNATGTSLFFGTDSGFVYALNAEPASGGCAVVASDDPLRTVVGMAVVTDDEDAVIYLTSDIGEIARVEYNEGRGFEKVVTSERRHEPTEILVAPAVLENKRGDDAEVLFVSGKTRDGRTTRPVLQGWNKKLEKYVTVTLWGSSVSFVFKPEEDGVVPHELLVPIVDQDTYTLLVASSDGYLYAFDLSQFE